MQNSYSDPKPKTMSLILWLLLQLIENGYDSDQKLHANLPSWHFVTDTYLWRLASHLNARSRYERVGKKTKKTKGAGGGAGLRVPVRVTIDSRSL